MRLLFVATDDGRNVLLQSVTQERWRDVEIHRDALKARCDHLLVDRQDATRVAVYVINDVGPNRHVTHSDRPPRFEDGDRISFRLRRDQRGGGEPVEATVVAVIGELGSTLVVRYDDGDSQAISAFGARKVSADATT